MYSYRQWTELNVPWAKHVASPRFGIDIDLEEGSSSVVHVGDAVYVLSE